MQLDELKQAVQAADPTAILVAPRILRRVIQAEFKVPYLLVQVPHEQCYFFDRQTLFRHVEQDELDMEPDRLLPPTIVLLARPSAERLQTADREGMLLKYWRLLFHAQVHLALERRRQDGHLSDLEVAGRVEAIGPAEFEEIRTVLEQENYLLPPSDDLHTYIEFAAVYLELRYFRKNLRASYFPAIRDFDAIDRLLARDADADALFAQSRLPGAPDPPVRSDTSSDESHDYYWKIMRHAERTAESGDTVRAAILHTKAARVAPVALTPYTRTIAHQNLGQLAVRMQDALRLTAEETSDWQQILPALLDKADQGTWPDEAKLLYDLQKVCVENERKLYALDIVGWVQSAGKRSIKRPLTSLKIVRITNHLRSAAKRLTMARVSDDDRHRLANLLQATQEKCEERLREHFRPILRDSFHDVGLTAANPPEQVALNKMIEELLDRIVEYGFFTFSDLRDTVSRNQFKLTDLIDPHAFWWGDPLLRLDRRLSSPMDGVYRRGEFYLRWLESLSALFFGTGVGRFFTQNIAIPFGGAYAAIKSSELILHGIVAPGLDLKALWTCLPLGLFFLALIRSGTLRQMFVRAGQATYKSLRLVFYEVPLRLWQLPMVREVLKSWPVLLIYWYLFKPLVVCAALAIWWPDLFGPLPIILAVFLASTLFLNSRFGLAISEACKEAAVLVYTWVRFDAIQGLVRLILSFFKQVNHTVEYVLYSVDEWLRFRGGENRLSMVLRSVLGVLWFPIGYLARLYFATLVEPSLNPIKLPISSLAFKFLLLVPWYTGWMIPTEHNNPKKQLIDWLGPQIGGPMALWITYAFVIPTLWLMPSVIAFFFWEMQENWRLFRTNRSTRLKPVAIGRHSETMLQLLKPGFHSGTIPKLFENIRHAELEAYQTNNWQSARTYRQALKEVSVALRLFIEREFLALLNQSPLWPDGLVSVGKIEVSCTRIRGELIHREFTEESVWLTFEERRGWLIAGLQNRGWIKRLYPDQAAVLNAALTGLFKLAGVGYLWEPLDGFSAGSSNDGTLVPAHRIPWMNIGSVHEIALTRTDYHANGERHEPKMDAARLYSFQTPITWQEWIDYWQRCHKSQPVIAVAPPSAQSWPAESRPSLQDPAAP